MAALNLAEDAKGVAPSSRRQIDLGYGLTKPARDGLAGQVSAKHRWLSNHPFCLLQFLR
jgi:hypothetical protein